MRTGKERTFTAKDNSYRELSIDIDHNSSNTAYEEYIFQSIKYSRAGGSYQDMFDRGLLISMRLLYHGFMLLKLKSPLRNVRVLTITCLTVTEYLSHT